MSNRTCSIEGCEKPSRARSMCDQHYRQWAQDNGPICSIEGCERVGRNRGWCRMHYERWRTHGDPTMVARNGKKPPTNPTCSMDGCEGRVAAWGWCDSHYRRWRANGDPDVVRKVARYEQACSVVDCERRAESRDLCRRHYQRLLKHGDPAYNPPTTDELFWAKVDRRGPDECWEWTAARSPNGYGRFKPKGMGQKTASRWSYEMHVGPIPDGMQVCHTCDNPPCVNPAHLWLGDHAANAADRDAKGRQWQQRKTHCKHGHPFDEVNTRFAQGRRYCRSCERERSRRRLARRHKVTSDLHSHPTDPPDGLTGRDETNLHDTTPSGGRSHVIPISARSTI